MNHLDQATKRGLIISHSKPLKGFIFIMVTIAGGILLALAILSVGFLMIVLFISGVLFEIAWTLTKWLGRLILLLSPIPILMWANQSGSRTLMDIGSLAVLGALCYLDYLRE